MASSVLITTEGTYPYFGGGVSVWCDQLVRQLSEFNFHIFAVVPSPKDPSKFSFPPNVTACRPFPLWGTELPGPQERWFSKTYELRLRTTRDSVRKGLLPPLRKALAGFLSEESNPQQLGEAFAELAQYFEDHDFATSMRSRDAWEAFREACRQHLPTAAQPSLDEAVDAMRWLVRYLSVAAIRLPEVDVVHASMAGLAGVPGVVAKLRRNVPFVLTEHGVYLRELYLSLARSGYSFWRRAFLFRLTESIARMNYYHADTITSLGAFNTKWMIRLGASPEKVVTATNGVDPELFRPTGEPKPERPTVLTLARVFPLKGIEVLLRAASAVKAQVPNVQFRILGEAADDEYYQDCLRIVEEEGLQDCVEWGETHRPFEEYPKAHLFCLPSLSEGVPFSILEAMLCRCPVVATDVGNVAEIVGSTGLTVRPNSPPELAAALIAMLGPGSEALRESMADKAFERALSLYTISQSTGRFRDIYRDLIGRRKTAVFEPLVKSARKRES